MTVKQAQSTYGTYLQSDHWHKIRSTILARDEKTCVVCGESRSTLHVHHRTYARVGHELLSDLITLCELCHQEFHDNGYNALAGKAPELSLAELDLLLTLPTPKQRMAVKPGWKRWIRKGKNRRCRTCNRFCAKNRKQCRVCRPRKRHKVTL